MLQLACRTTEVYRVSNLPNILATEKEKQKAEKIKKFLNFEVFEPTEMCQILDKNNEVVSTETLTQNELVGLYFSAHWCGPCKVFTPKLANFYKDCNEASKTFEVVFVSSDRNQEEFDGYFGEMPWLTLRLNNEYSLITAFSLNCFSQFT